MSANRAVAIQVAMTAAIYNLWLDRDRQQFSIGPQGIREITDRLGIGYDEGRHALRDAIDEGWIEARAVSGLQTKIAKVTVRRITKLGLSALDKASAPDQKPIGFQAPGG